MSESELNTGGPINPPFTVWVSEDNRTCQYPNLTATKTAFHIPAPIQLTQDALNLTDMLNRALRRGQRINERRARWDALRTKHQRQR